MKLYWTTEARKDYKTFKEDSNEAAEESISRLVERISRLKDHPAIGHRFKNKKGA